MRQFVLMVLALTFSACQSPAATVVFSDRFNHIPVGTVTTLPNWAVTRGSIDVIGRGTIFDLYPGHGRYIDLDGSTWRAGRIETAPQALTVGDIYAIRFLLGVNGDTAETLSFGVGNTTFKKRIRAGGIGPDMIRITRRFTATSTSGALFFAASGGDNQGPILDGIRLLQSPAGTAATLRAPATVSAVPLPEALWMFLVALVLLARPWRALPATIHARKAS